MGLSARTRGSKDSKSLETNGPHLFVRLKLQYSYVITTHKNDTGIIQGGYGDHAGIIQGSYREDTLFWGDDTVSSPVWMQHTKSYGIIRDDRG